MSKANNMEKLGQVKLYEDIIETKENQKLIDGYNKIIGYQKNYEFDLSKENNGKIDMQGGRIDNNGVVFEKLVNIEAFAFNAINNIFEFEMIEKYNEDKDIIELVPRKINNKKVLNNGVDFLMSGISNINNSFGPAHMLELREGKKRVKENQERAEQIKRNFKNKNITKKQAINKILERII